MFPLSNKVVLLTGASGGLGKALCRALLQQGAKVVAVDIDEQALEMLATELSSPELSAYQLDVTDADACQSIVAEVSENLGGIDVLINNAGVTHFSRFRSSSLTVLSRVLDINLRGSFNITHAALESICSRQGMIVGLSSVAGFSPLFGRCAYSASKHGLEGMLDTLRVELVDAGVHVLTVCPAFIQTQPTQRDVQEIAEGVARPGQASATAGRVMIPDEAAVAIIAAMKGRRRRLLLGKVAVFAWWASRLLPKFYEWVMVRQTRNEVQS